MDETEAISWRAWAGVLIPLLVAIALSGCSGGDPLPVTMPASGTVNLDGKPLDGTIRFIPAPPFEGRAAAGTVKDGKFSIDAEHGLISGSHRVEIESAVAWGFAEDDDEAYTKKVKEGWTPPPGAVLPEYNRNSKLTRQVEVGKPAEFTFELKTAAAAP